MIDDCEPELTLMALWSRHKQECRPLSGIVADARSGRLPGIGPLESGFGYRITNKQAALAAMKMARQKGGM